MGPVHENCLTVAKRKQWDAIDWTLLALITCLSVFLLSEVGATAATAWRNRVRPGGQGVLQLAGQSGEEAFAASVQSSCLLYLPPSCGAYRLWPLVVFLHGAGERGADVKLIRRTGPACRIDEGWQPEFILASPQCPVQMSWEPEDVIRLIERLCHEFAVDQDRVYLTGFSMGGYGTWATACHEPKRFAAIAPLASGGPVSSAERLKSLPIWAFHGDHDEVVPFEASKSMVEAVRKSGGHVEFTAYAGGDHAICRMTYDDERFWKWLLTQRRGRSKSTTSEELQ